jgi:hypothetical protein
VALEVLYISQQRNNQALEESPPFLVILASWKCKEQTSILALPSYTPKLATNLTLERSHNRLTSRLRMFKIILF